MWEEMCNWNKKVNAVLSSYQELRDRLNTTQFLVLVDFCYNGAFYAMRNIVVPGLNNMRVFQYDNVLDLFQSTVSKRHEYRRGLLNRRRAQCDQFFYGFGG